MFTYKSTYVSIKCYELWVMANPIFFFIKLVKDAFMFKLSAHSDFEREHQESADRSDSY